MSEHTKLVIERVPIHSIRANPRHTRKCEAVQVKRTKRSILTFGYNVPILVDRYGQIIAGHVRWEALKALGYTEVCIIRLEHLTPEASDGRPRPWSAGWRGWTGPAARR